jgi:hypothetical protein
MVTIVVSGCRIPRIPVKQTVDYKGEFSVDGTRIRHYRTRNFVEMDSTQQIRKLEYLPIEIFTVLDNRDSVKLYVVGTWQEYLWRFSERLDQVDRQYYVPSPLTMQFGGDTAVIVWGYPSIEGRDRDLRDVVKRRNNYWSIDLIKPNSTPDEVWNGVLQSFPQQKEDKYSPYTRFIPGGMYDKSMAADTTRMLRLMHKELNKALGKPEEDESNP